ncbi:sulfotransferase family 2 domain-containing protein [Nocardioides acrostichi]|uniref:Sulfotransferase family 2 domain-containing protein n=1 Tax=Nocardioides acrostichi TaxID=2784339 RepID=A0A930Y9D2_9ACTN|nr:sulfotransferase family 2 domain-containing protein [Nocardioides acrostichi]MBF4160238.1 sulfotransferase family 2 domain-containing protein [Nocardioides acrostichi]
MMVSHERRMLFVHVQKTGGSTIDTMLEQAIPDAEYLQGLRGGRHARLAPALKQYPELGDYFIFGFVRNPWARMYSWYAMIQRAQENADAGVEKAAKQLRKNRLWKKVLADHPDFETFIMRGPEDHRELRRPQISYLRTTGRRADFIGRQERFDKDLQKVWGRMGLEWPGESLKVNTGPSTDYREHYTPQMRDKVAEVFAKDVKRFKYEF